MRIRVAPGASHVRETKGQDLIRTASGSYFVAVRAGNRRVRPGQRVPCLLVHRRSESRLVEILDRVAIFALVLIGRGGKLIVVRILMAIEARGEFDFVDGVFARR